MCRHVYDWNIVNCDVKQPIQLNSHRPFSRLLRHAGDTEDVSPLKPRRPHRGSSPYTFRKIQKATRQRRRQYDLLIIERTIGLVFGPSTALHIPFLKHCTLTKKVVGTIWRALSKPPRRRQGPDLITIWLLVGIPSAIRPELASSRAEHSLPYSDVTIYNFAI